MRGGRANRVFLLFGAGIVLIGCPSELDYSYPTAGDVYAGEDPDLVFGGEPAQDADARAEDRGSGGDASVEDAVAVPDGEPDRSTPGDLVVGVPDARDDTREADDPSEEVWTPDPGANGLGSCSSPRVARVGMSRVIDLCDLGDHAHHVIGEGCSLAAGEGDDLVFELTIDRAQSIRAGIADWDDGAGIDTVIYLRERCDVAESQISCSDDNACGEFPMDIGACDGGVQPRHSALYADLEPGTYYLVLDTRPGERNGQLFSCGEVLFEIWSM